MVTYKDLLDGYILQVGDIIDNCHGVRGLEVRNDYEGEYFLYDPEHINDYIYDVVGIEPKGEGCGDFPELESLKALTNEVMRIFQASPFKIGDKVKIKERTMRDDDYPFCFSDEMSRLKGKIFTIENLYVATWDLEKCEGDPHEYELRDSGGWTWHSSMFEKVDAYEEHLKDAILEQKSLLKKIEELPPKDTPIHINVKSSTIKIVL